MTSPVALSSFSIATKATFPVVGSICIRSTSFFFTSLAASMVRVVLIAPSVSYVILSSSLITRSTKGVETHRDRFTFFSVFVLIVSVVSTLRSFRISFMFTLVLSSFTFVTTSATFYPCRHLYQHLFTISSCLFDRFPSTTFGAS